MVSIGIGRRLQSKNSLVSRFQFMASLLVITLIGGGLVFVVLSSYRMANNERDKTILAIGNGLARLVARPLSWGDYVGLQDIISGIRIPSFICDIEVTDSSGHTIANLSPSGNANKCSQKEASIQFEVTKLGELNSGMADDTMGRVQLKIDNSDLQSRYLNILFLGIVIGVTLLLLLLLISRVAIIRAFRPLSTALDAAISNQSADHRLKVIAPIEVQPLIEKMNILYDQQAKSETKIRIGEMAKQVAHDIRSPLSALNMVTGSLNGEMTEQKRLIIRAASQRINDIANNLLSPISAPSNDRRMKSEMLIPLIEGVISEKRVQFREKLNVEIQSDISNGYGLFAKMDPIEMARVLSNLINNSIESFKLGVGLIKVSVMMKGDYADIVIQDNGPGIPDEILAKIGRQGFSYGKPGSGLGVYHAMKILKDINGKFEIKSRLGIGTTVTLSLPITQPPSWFVRTINVGSGKIVSVDDDRTIHQIWAARLSALRKHHSKIDHCMFSSIEEFEGWLVKNNDRSTLFLIDYEFLNQPENGLQLIERLKIASQSILVTSRYDENAVRQKAEALGIKIVPKSLAAHIPITFTEISRSPAVERLF